jgi:hypothetical protein
VEDIDKSASFVLHAYNLEFIHANAIIHYPLSITKCLYKVSKIRFAEYDRK